MSEITKALKWRYATKKFDPSKKLSDSKLDIIKESFNLTATSFGLQPVRLVIIKDPSLKKSLVAYSMDQQQVSDCSHLLVFCIEKAINSGYVSDYFNRVKQIRNTPDDILAPYKEYLESHFDKKASQEVSLWATKQAYLAMGNLLTVCAMEEIDACPMEGFQPEKYDEILKLDQYNLRSVLIMPIGYRSEEDIFSTMEKVRKSIDEATLEIN